MKRVFRLVGIALGIVAGLAVVTGTVLFLVGSSRVNRIYNVETAALQLVTDSAGIAHGEHLAKIYGCVDCHTPDFSGRVFADDPPFRIVASNLTRGAGGVGDLYTPELLDRAIRHGVGADGKALQVMPSAAFHDLGDEDAAHLISYLVQLPPVDNELPETEFRPLGRLLSAFAYNAALEVDTSPARRESVPASATTEFGEYYAATICAYCHGEDLKGMQPHNPASPFAPDLTAVGRWSTDQFITTMRTGMSPGNRVLNPEFMPWTMTAHATDEELLGVHAYLATLASSPN